MTDPDPRELVFQELDRIVEAEDAKRGETFWTASRVIANSSRPGVAIWSTLYLTADEAKQACQVNSPKRLLEWKSRSSKMDAGWASKPGIVRTADGEERNVRYYVVPHQLKGGGDI